MKKLNKLKSDPNQSLRKLANKIRDGIELNETVNQAETIFDNKLERVRSKAKNRR